MSLHKCPPVTPVVGIVGCRGSMTPEVASWMRESFQCRNSVIHVDDFTKTSTELKRLSSNNLLRKTSQSGFSNQMQGLKETPQAVNLGALQTTIKVARQTWAGDRFIIVEGCQLLADEELTGLLDVKIFIDADMETCRAQYSGDLGYFDEFVWPLYLQFNESFICGTAPAMAVAFHTIKTGPRAAGVYEAAHRTLSAY